MELWNLLNGTRELKKNFDKKLEVTPEGRTTGTVAIGGVSKDDLQGLMKGKSISDLRDLMINGSIYITIDTRDFPNGEIRGNSFVGIDRLFPDYTDIQFD